MADLGTLREIAGPDQSATAIRETWAPMASFLWTPGDGEDYSARMTVTATVDEGTVGQVRFRVAGSGNVTRPLTFGELSPNELAPWLNLGFGERTIVLEGRRVQGAGGLRILRAFGIVALTALADVEPAPEAGTAVALLGPLEATATIFFGTPGPWGEGNILDADSSSFEVGEGLWVPANATVGRVVDLSTPAGRWALQATAAADGDVVLNHPDELDVFAGEWLLYGSARTLGPARLVRWTAEIVDANGIVVSTQGGDVWERLDIEVEEPVPPVEFVIAEAVDAQGNGAVEVASGAVRGGVQHFTVVPTEGIESVELFVDGALVGERMTAAPFVATVDTTTLVNGGTPVSAVVTHTVDGPTGPFIATQRPSVTVQVDNDVTPPLPTFQMAKAPTSSGANAVPFVPSARVAGTVHVTIAPSSPRVSGVVFRRDGVVVSPGPVWSWDTTTAADGPVTLSATVTTDDGDVSVAVPLEVANDAPVGPGTPFHAPLVGVGHAGSSSIQKAVAFEAWLNRPTGSMAGVSRLPGVVRSWHEFHITNNDLVAWAATGRDMFVLNQGFFRQEEFDRKDGYVDDVIDSSANRVRIPVRPTTHDGRTSTVDFQRTKQSSLATGMQIDIRHVGTGVMLAGARTIQSVTRTSTYVELQYSGTSVNPTTAHGVFRTGVNTLSAGANGEYNAFFATFARHLASTFDDGQVVRMSFLHEGNGDWSAHSGAGKATRHEAFRNFFAQGYQTMRPLLPPTIYIDFLKATGAKHAPFELLWPGDDNVDDMQEDSYNRGIPSSLTGEARWAAIRDQPEGLAETRDFCIAHNKRVGYQEWGLDSESGGDDVTYVRRMSEWCKGLGNRLTGQFYFNINEPIGGAEGNTEFKYHVIHPTTVFPNGAAEYQRQWRLA